MLCLYSGIVDHIDYVPGSGRQLLAKNATLELCDAAVCKPTKVTVTVKLDPSEDSSNRCEVDAKSIEARNQFCGMATAWVSPYLFLHKSPVDLLNFK